MHHIIESLDKLGIQFVQTASDMIETFHVSCEKIFTEPRATLAIDLGTHFCHCSACKKDFTWDEIEEQLEKNKPLKRKSNIRQKKSRTDQKINIRKDESEQTPLIIDRDIDFQEVHDAISEIGIVDKETLYIVVAVAISAQLRLNPPLWLLLIGVPSSFKTELVGLLGHMKEVFTLDTLTENAFASGFVPKDGSEPKDLLPLLDDKCFIIKDLNTIFSMNSELVKKILGDLTSIFDGKFEKYTATRGMIAYNSLFSIIGCITPSILIKHYNYATQLGPRFFFLRLPELTKEERNTSFKKSWDETNREEKIRKTRLLVSSFCTQLAQKIKTCTFKPEAEGVQNKINCIANFVCQARGIAITEKANFKNEKGEQVEYYEIKDWQVEQPWRILNQLKHLLRILSFIEGKDGVDEGVINIIKPIVLSTMPVDRAQILRILTTRCGISIAELAKEITKSPKTIRRTMRELEALRIVDCYKDADVNVSGKAPWLYYIVEEYASVLQSPMPSQESLSQSKSVLDEEDSDEDKD